jgi:integrase
MHTEVCATCRQRPPVTQAGVLAKHKTAAGRPCAGSGQPPGLGAWTIQGVAAHMSGLLSAATEEGLIPANPAAGIKLPTVSRKPVFWWTRTEATQILLQLGGDDAMMVDLEMHIGLRPGELFGLRRQYVDTDRWQIHVYGVATRTGWRPHAKSTKSHRAVPVPPHLRDALWRHLGGLAHDDLVFPAPGGGIWDDRNYARRVFEPAVTRAGVRRGTVYDMRHTAASWLVQKGVPLLEVQQLLGHEKYSTTLIYAHLAPGAFDSVLDAWGTEALDPRSHAASASDPHEAPRHEEDPAARDPGNGV